MLISHLRIIVLLEMRIVLLAVTGLQDCCWYFFWNQRFGLELSVDHVLRAYIPAHRQLDNPVYTGHRHLFLVMQGVHMLLPHACTAVQMVQYGGADRCEHMSPACQSTISSVMLRVIMPLPNSIANQQAHGAGQMAYDVTICSAGWCN